MKTRKSFKLFSLAKKEKRDRYYNQDFQAIISADRKKENRTEITHFH